MSSLSPAELGTLRTIAAQFRKSRSGCRVLFTGPKRKAKLVAARWLAHEFQLDLYRVDLSAVAVSKYIGETEKNLRRLFDAAAASGAILLFDEADALFGKRSGVKDSANRYANLETGYFLQQMEKYTGLSIVTTRTQAKIDPVFLKKFRFSSKF